MERIALTVIVIGLGMTALMLFPSVKTITLPEKIVEVNTIEVKDELVVRVETAHQEALEEIETKAKAAYEAAKTQALKEIELKVTAAYRKEVEAREAALEKDLSL